jgi:predicted secreted protein
MKIGSWIAIYFVIWWVSLFTVLPFGVRSQLEEGEVVPGSEPGAPARPRWIRILLVNSALSLVYLAGIWWLIENHWPM